MEQLLNMAGSGLVIFQCKLAIDAAKAKSRWGSWILMKRVLWLMLGHVAIYLVIFGVRMIAMFSIIQEFEDLEWDEGSYSINDNRNRYEYWKGHAGSHQPDDEDEALFGAVFYSFIITSLCGQVFCLAICCAPCFGCYYKFHKGIKKYEEIVTGMGLQGPTPPNLNQPNIVLQQ